MLCNTRTNPLGRTATVDPVVPFPKRAHLCHSFLRSLLLLLGQVNHGRVLPYSLACSRFRLPFFLPCFRFSYFLASSVLALTYDNFMTLIATNVLVSGHSLSVYLYLCIFISPASTFRAREPHKSKV